MVAADLLNRDLPPDSVKPWKVQHVFRLKRWVHGFGLDQSRPVPGKISTQHTSYIEQRTTAANQALVVWAVTDAIAVGTQNGFLQTDGVDKSKPFAVSIGT